MDKIDRFEAANRKAEELRASLPRAVRARYDRRIGRVVAPRDAEGLEGASPAQLDAIEISPSGFGIHFPKLDADIYLPALLEGFLGSRKWIASRLGAQGGKSKSPAKAAAAKQNGRAGGRPRKREAAA